MKRLIAITSLIVAATQVSMNADWKPVEGSMLTEWGAQVTPENAWREYPRPQMKRENWTNLNGIWHFAVTPRGAIQPEEWEQEILVPFALETPLSGVGKRLEDSEALWYLVAETREHQNGKSCGRYPKGTPQTGTIGGTTNPTDWKRIGPSGLISNPWRS